MLLDIVVKATLVLGVAGLFSVASRGRTTAAVRHAVWVAALVGAVLVPALAAALPALRVPLLPAELRPSAAAPATRLATAPANAATPAAPAVAATRHRGQPVAIDGRSDAGVARDDESLRRVEVPTPARAAEATAATDVVDTRAFVRSLRDAVSGIPLLAAAWALGAALLLVRVVVSRLSAARVTRTRVPGRAPWLPVARRLARIMRVSRRLRFLRSDRVAMPMAYGILHPAVVLPSEADAWSADRLEAVLLHELGHVRRRDCLTQVAADAALAALWFHPLAWVARRAIRRERERACDDLVLAAGTPAPEYASHLLDVARDARLRSSSLALAGGVAMARPSELEGRLMAILDDTRPRRALTLRASATVGLLTLGVVAPMSALDLWQAPGSSQVDALPASPTERPRPDGRGRLRLADADGHGPVAYDEAGAALQEPMPMPTPAPSPAVAPVAVVTPTPTPTPAPTPAIAANIAAAYDLDVDVDFDFAKVVTPAVAQAWSLAPVAPLAALQTPQPPVGVKSIAPGPAKATRTPPDPRVVAALTDALKDSDVEVRRQALHTLSRFRDPAVVDALVGVLSHTDADMRRQAAFALSSIRDPRAQKALGGAMNDQDPQVRRQALFSLARQKDPAAFDPLVAALKDTDPEVRQQAAFALGQLRDARAAAPLGTVVADANAEVRQSAVFALGQLRSAEAIGPLQAALKDSDPEVRERAAFALGQLRDPRAVDALMTATKDTDTDVRKQAYFALGQVGDTRAQDLAIAGLKDSDPEVRRMAAHALARMTDRD